MNKVTLIGNVTRDLELKNYNDGRGSYVKFTLAVHEYSRQLKEDTTIFINVVAFGNKAETLCKYITKGRKLAVDGKLNTGSYTDNDGKKKYSTAVFLENFYFVDNNKEENSEVI